MVQKSEKSGILNAKSMKDEQSTELRLNPAFPTNCASTGRKSRQNLTEVSRVCIVIFFVCVCARIKAFLCQAEMEARKIRRVLANRESARQTIRRRQVLILFKI